MTSPATATSSQELFDRARAMMPGGVNSPVRAFGSVGGDPVSMVRAAGPYLTDAEGREYVEINGARKHAIGYLQDFLFSPARANSPVRSLSGGERNRLLLARLFARAA